MTAREACERAQRRNRRLARALGRVLLRRLGSEPVPVPDDASPGPRLTGEEARIFAACAHPEVRAERLRVLLELCGEERHLSAEEALRYGLGAAGTPVVLHGMTCRLLMGTASDEDFALAQELVNAGMDLRDREWARLEATGSAS